MTLLAESISTHNPLIRVKICNLEEPLSRYTLKFVQVLYWYYSSEYVPAIILAIVGIVWPL